MTTDTLDQALADVDAMETEAAERFEELARQFQAGETIAPTEVATILKAADKSKDDLRSLVQLLVRRAALRESLATAAKLRERNVELHRLIEQQNELLEQRVAEHRAACRPLQNELADNNATINSTFGAENELRTGCVAPDLLSQQRAIMHRREASHAKRKGIRDLLDRAKQHRNSHDYQNNLGNTREVIHARIERHERDYAAACAEGEEIDQQSLVVMRALIDW